MAELADDSQNWKTKHSMIESFGRLIRGLTSCASYPKRMNSLESLK